MSKNQVFTGFCVILCLFLGALCVIERNREIYQERVDAMLSDAQLKMKLLELEAHMLKVEMGFVTVDAYLARARGWYSLELNYKNKNARY